MHTTMAIVHIRLGASKVLEDNVFALQKLKEEVQNDFERVELRVEDHCNPKIGYIHFWMSLIREAVCFV
jgi:hypothetical protein